MADDDRLSQIWGAFAQSTTRYLTDTNIENIPRPDYKGDHHRSGSTGYAGAAREHGDGDPAFAGLDLPDGGLPDGAGEPAQAALRALREKLSPADPGAESGARHDRAGQTTADQTTADKDPASRRRESGVAPRDYPEDRLFEDLKATALLTVRREASYLSYAIEQHLLVPKKQKRRGLLSFFRKKNR